LQKRSRSSYVPGPGGHCSLSNRSPPIRSAARSLCGGGHQRSSRRDTGRVVRVCMLETERNFGSTRAPATHRRRWASLALSSSPLVTKK
jgi:hypothetical protein